MYQGRAERPTRATLIAISTGLLLGAVTLLLAMRLGVLALALPVVGIAVLPRRGLAVGAGVLVLFGLGYIWAIAAANEWCADFNRQPNASCQTYGTDEQLVLAGCVATLGALLAAFVLAREARLRRSAMPS
jgi:hypothetical protein